MLSTKCGYYYEQQIYLEGEESTTVELLIDWIKDGTPPLDRLEQDILSKTGNERTLGDGCHLFCNLFCLWAELKILMNGGEVIEKIVNLLYHVPILPLQPRTIRVVFQKLPRSSKLIEIILKVVADDLVKETGHHDDYYADLLKGDKAVPGLAKALLIRMKEPGPHGRYRWTGQIMLHATWLEFESQVTRVEQE